MFNKKNIEIEKVEKGIHRSAFCMCPFDPLGEMSLLFDNPIQHDPNLTQVRYKTPSPSMESLFDEPIRHEPSLTQVKFKTRSQSTSHGNIKENSPSGVFRESNYSLTRSRTWYHPE